MTSRFAFTALALALIAAACGGDDSETTAPVISAGASTAAPPACADSFADGQVPQFDEANPQCTDPDGGIQVLGAFRCADGTHLVTVDKNTGAFSAGWYLTGQPFHPTDDVAGDTAYGDAYRTCNQ